MSEIALFTGGARSGKSTLAESAAHASGGDAVSYIATARILDDEMSDRVLQHRTRRPPMWQTIEEPLDLAAALHRTAHAVVLVDCLTMWTTNVWLAHGEAAVYEGLDRFLDAARVYRGHLAIVTNEVGWSVVPDNPLARTFRDLMGVVNSRVMTEASWGVLAVCGHPLHLKGKPWNTLLP